MSLENEPFPGVLATLRNALVTLSEGLVFFFASRVFALKNKGYCDLLAILYNTTVASREAKTKKGQLRWCSLA